MSTESYPMVLRITVKPDADKTYVFEVLGLLSNLQWDYSTCDCTGAIRSTPVKFGRESDTTYLVSSADLGLPMRTCADYKNARELYVAQLTHDRVYGRPWRFDKATETWIPPPPYDQARMDGLKSTLETVGAVIMSAVDTHFPQWLGTLTQTTTATV